MESHSEVKKKALESAKERGRSADHVEVGGGRDRHALSSVWEETCCRERGLGVSTGVKTSTHG